MNDVLNSDEDSIDQLVATVLESVPDESRRSQLPSIEEESNLHLNSEPSTSTSTSNHQVRFVRFEPTDSTASNNYGVGFPDFSHVGKRTFTMNVSCRGCNKQFKKSTRGHYEPDYYYHCVKQCDNYKRLSKLIIQNLILI